MATPGWYPDPSGQPQMYRYWDGQSWSEQTTSNPSAPPPGPSGPPPAPPTEVAPGQYGAQDPYQQQYGQQSPYAQPQPGRYGGGGYGGESYGQPGYPGGSDGGSGKRIALIALAVVLIAGLATGGFFGVRALAGNDGDDKADDAAQTEETEDTGSPTEESPTEESPTEEPTDEPTESGPTGRECTGGLPTIGGETTRRGRIEGGDLVLPPVGGYEPVEPQILSVFTFADEVAATYQQIEESWIAMYAVGALTKANGYTDLEASADQVITCMSESPNFYRNFTERDDLDREEIEVDGHPAYSITTEIRIDDPDISVDGDLARVIVVDAGDDEKFGLYVSVVPIGDQKLIDQQESATGTLEVSD